LRLVSRYPLVGRTAALAELDEVLAGGRRSWGELVLITGEPGIGKTRLAEEAAERAAGYRIAWCACGPAGAVTFQPWRRLFRVAGLRQSDLALANAFDAGSGRVASFDEVVDELAAAAAEEPILAIFDDLHEADASSLELLSYLAPQLRATRLVLLATARDTSAVWAERMSVWSSLLRVARCVQLPALTTDEVGEVIAASGPIVAADTLRVVASRTGGNPLLVTELVAYLRGRRQLGDPVTALAVPTSVRSLVAGRAGRLPAATQRQLQLAAVLGRESSLDELAQVTGADPAAIERDLEPAVADGLIAHTAAGGLAFSHDLVRDACYDEMSEALRRSWHAAVGTHLATWRGQQAGAAYHLLRAGPEHAVEAADLCWQSGSAAEAMGAYEDAANWFRQALGAAEQAGQESVGELQLAYGGALLAAGDRATARTVLLATAEDARRSADPLLLARSGLALAGPAGFEVSLLDADQIDFLAEARDTLPTAERAVRALVAARLSIALTSLDDQQRRRQLATEAEMLAREAGDHAALAEALAARCDAFAGPAHVSDRTGWSSEIVALAVGRRSPSLELLGRRLRLQALLECGDLAGADAEITAFQLASDKLRHPGYSWYLSLWRAMRALAEGRIGDSELLADEAERQGRRATSENAAILVTTLRWCLAGELADPARLAAFELPNALIRSPGVWPLVTIALHDLWRGRIGQARTQLDGLLPRLTTAEDDSEWLPMMAQLSELVAGVGGHPIGAVAYASLLPYADLYAVEGIGAVLRCPIQRSLGLLAAAAGDLEAAAAHFDVAVERSRALGASLVLARTLHDAGLALDDPGRLSEAAELYRVLGCTDRLAKLTTEHPEPLPHSDETVSAVEPNAFRREGEVWELRYGGLQIRLRDSKGLRDIARLLREPGRAVPALELAAAPMSLVIPGEQLSVQGDLGEVIDATARAAYRARLVELDEEAAEADERGDIVGSESAAREREALISQLAAAYGLGGRVRRVGHPSERARTAVTARIRDSLRRIDAAHPDLGRHLSRSIRTGTVCVYEPDQPTTWFTQ
jgi:tetratricopeptide (TPR) repeat protein